MDATIVLLWYFGGLVVAFLLLEMILPRGRPTKKGTPESSAYRWTINLIYLHMFAGLITGIVEYILWFRNLGPTENFWDWWPTLLVYIGCILLDVFLIQLIFNPRYSHYVRAAEKQRR